MSQQHRKWIELVKERIEKRGWSQTDLAIVVGVSPSASTQLFKNRYEQECENQPIMREIRGVKYERYKTK